MTKAAGGDREDSSAPDRPRRVRLHPREGSEHRFSFARRWESRRRARSHSKIWMLATIDIGAVVLIYWLARELIRRLGGE